MATFNLQQQAFTLSMVASAGDDDTGSPGVIESELEFTIDEFLKDAEPLIGTWSLAWGPVVYESGSPVAANAMFVAQGTDAGGNPAYVVAIAATNLRSHFDVITEDLDVTLTAWPSSWPAQPPSTLQPNITQGTIDGVDALLDAVDPYSPGGTLQDFLSGARSTSATLIFTGHSLGGALAPALALALFGAPSTGSLNPADWGAVYLYPTAGPTVGDQDYASFWNSVFPPVTDSSQLQWNQLVWNTMDVVPHAWANITALDKIYSPQISTSGCLGIIIAGLVLEVLEAGGTFVQPNNISLPGTFSVWSGSSSSSPMIPYFLVETLYQHVYAYFELLGVDELLTASPSYFPTVTDPTANPTAPPAVVALCTALVKKAGSLCSGPSAGCGSSSAG
ncbi:MAG TPA: hypothetical protein VFT45_02625 [Longimicrobium sp.]|nr:hypothetical protein [Longimicrobium sp.]